MKLTKVYQGKDYNALMILTDGDSVVIDITGYTLTFVGRRHSATTNSITRLLVLSDPTNGVATLNLSVTDTDVDLGEYSFQIVGTDDAGEAHVFDTGHFTLQESYA